MTIQKRLLFCLLAVAVLAAPAAAQVVEEIVAIVNDDIITLSQVKFQHDIIYQSLRNQLKGEEFDKAYAKTKSELLNSMINELLLLQLAKEKDYNPAEAVKQNIDNIKKENNLTSDDELREVLRKQGMTYEAFVKQMEENLLKQMTVAYEVDRFIVVDDSEVIKYYKANPTQFTEPEEYKLKAVYLAYVDGGEEAVEARKKDIIEKLKAGEAFEAVAEAQSDSPIKEVKGELGSFQKGQLEKSLEDVVGTMKKGDMSSWIKAKNGWYLLSLEDKKDIRLKTFEEVKKNVEEKLFMEKRGKKIEEFMKQLRTKSYIKILKPNPFDGM